MRWRRVADPVVLGAISALGFEPFGCWPLTLLTFAWLLRHVARTTGPWAAFRAGWLFGLGHFIVGLHWIATAFTYQSSMPASFGVAAVVLLSLYLAVFPGLAAAFARRAYAWRTVKLAGVLFFASFWMLGEGIRGTLFTGFAWNPLGTVWLGVAPVAGMAGWIGVYGLSGLLIVVAGAVWLAFERERRAALILAVVAMLPAVAFLRIPVSAPGAGVSVRIVQPNTGQDEKYEPAQLQEHERLYLRLSGRPTGAARVLLWPEAATPRFLELDPDARSTFAALLGPDDILLTGGESVVVDQHGIAQTYHNSVFALDSRGRILWRYDKSHLVPFGEYLPMRPLLESIGLSRLVPGDEDFASGPGARSFDLPSKRSVGIQVCYEIIFPGRVVDRAHRPDFLFNPSNDAWFGTWGPPQHFAQARMRAIEEGISVVRATPTGISGVIGPTGEIVRALPRNAEAALEVRVPPPLAPTLFSKFGLWASGCFALALALVAAASAFSRPRSSSR
jgi:apolipoprotein N-acyltransferase